MVLLTSLYATIFFAILSSSYCCDPRTFRAPDGTCQPCPLGSQNFGRNRTSCTPCRPGQSSYLNGTSPARVCQDCPAGFFSSEASSISCSPCPPRTNSQQGSSKCFRCGPGKRVGRDRCLQCERNEFSDGVANLECTPCPKGSVSEPGSSQCEPCPKGTLAAPRSFRGDTVCQPCIAGSFGDKEGAISCKICPPGTFSEASATECTPCPAGQFASRIASEECTRCPVGTDSLPGSAACKDPVRGCTFDTFEDAEGKCRACLPGQRLDVDKKECVACEPGQVSNGGVSTECTNCPDDQVPVENERFLDGFACRCPGGKTREGDGEKCISCPQDTFGKLIAESEQQFTGAPRSKSGDNLPNFVNDARCEFCSRAETDEEKAVCNPCPNSSFFDPFPGRCETCPEGYIFRGGTFRGIRCQSVKTGCMFPRVLNRGTCRILKCPKGTFFDKSDACLRCPKGSIYMSRFNECERCKRTETSPGGTATKCEKVCPRNANFDRDLGECRCDDELVLKDGKCTPCPPGTWKRFSSNKVCVPCRVGTVRGTSGRFCRGCGENEIPNKIRRNCQPCPAGLKAGTDVRGNRIDKCVPIDPYDRTSI